MFASSETIQAEEVFTWLPDVFRKQDTRATWSDARRGGKPIHSFFEGPSFDYEGNLDATDIRFGRTFRIRLGDPDMRTLYVADAGAGLIQTARPPVARRPMLSLR